jgi:photosystem II stability/assembly factor-like uncharacterized protein
VIAAFPPQVPTGPAIVFVDARRGLAAGAGGILGTRDGGRRWRLEFRGRVQALESADATHAWAIGGPTLLRTTNGVRWRVVSRPGLVAVDFVGRRHGYGLDQGGHLVTSSNGGANWSRIRAPLAQALCATTKGVWLARGESIWRRQGRRWVRALSSTRDRGSAVPDLRCRGESLWALFRLGAAAGSEAYDVYRSLDAGRSWRRVLANLDPAARLPRISAYSGPFDAVGRAGAVFVGSCAPCVPSLSVTVLSTGNGGASWLRVTPMSGSYPEAVSFPTADRGWLIAQPSRGRPAVWTTTDGGRHWHLVLRSRALAVAPP